MLRLLITIIVLWAVLSFLWAVVKLIIWIGFCILCGIALSYLAIFLVSATPKKYLGWLYKLTGASGWSAT
jgi:NhaP-type Na+/H+ or K+/H+ antiporter